MATTAAGTPYVESSDLVANYPGVSLALANHIDTIGKVLQVVRATDSTDRTTTSVPIVDANLSVTITPSSVSSRILLIASYSILNSGASSANFSSMTAIQITTAGNTPISGAENAVVGVSSFNVLANDNQIHDMVTIIGQHQPATISATTYKVRFARYAGSGLSTLRNATNTAQLFAIEVAA